MENAENISEVFAIMGPYKSNDAIFQKGLLNNMKTADYSTWTLFYKGELRNTIGLTEDDINEFKYFSIMYICYLLSNYPLRGMSGAVKNCSIKDVMNWVRKPSSSISTENTLSNEYAYQNLFQRIALNSYYCILGDTYVKSNDFKLALINENMFRAHIGEEWCLKAMLFLVYMEDPAYVETILAAWNEWGGDRNWAEYCDYDWGATFVNELPKDMSIYKALYGGVSYQCDKTREEQHVLQGGTPIGGYASSYKEVRTTIYYGEDVGKWLRETANDHSFFNREPAYVGTKAPDSGCVIKGTKILLSNLRECPIEMLKHNDQILSCENLPSTCSDGLIFNPNVTALYAVNEDDPFMSLEHPILTKRGWCSLEPEQSMQINPNYQVSELKIGDSFYKAVLRPSGLTFEEVIVCKINKVVYDIPQECFDLNIEDGYHSYFANGYPCLCNYPQITAASIRKAMEQLTDEECNTILNMLMEQRPLMEKLLGTNAVETLLTEQCDLSEKEHIDGME